MKIIEDREPSYTHSLKRRYPFRLHLVYSFGITFLYLREGSIEAITHHHYLALLVGNSFDQERRSPCRRLYEISRCHLSCHANLCLCKSSSKSSIFLSA